MKDKIILGVMSGTSLDGLDFALCKFNHSNEKFKYEILKTGFIEYSEDLKKNYLKLITCRHMSLLLCIKITEGISEKM